MPLSSQPVKSTRKTHSCLINAVILIVALVLMLALGEVAFRWLDGYQFSNLELQQDSVTPEPLDR